ncbi:MAG: dynamin family protein, partial [Planctomycetes bacterium]|nr:dynamin family protein [Planctomycetota bacterium]
MADLAPSLPPVRLPEGFVPLPYAGNFRYTALAFLAGVAHSDALLLPGELRAFQLVAEQTLGPAEWQSARGRATALALLESPPRPAETLPRVLEVVHSDCVSQESRCRLADQVLALIEGAGRPTCETFELLKRLMEGLAVPLAPLSARRDALARRIEQAAAAAPLLPPPPAPAGATAPSEAKSGFLGVIAGFWRRGGRGAANAGVLMTARGVANDEARRRGTHLLRLAQALGCGELERQVIDFLGQLEPQGCRIAIVGEMKHGKSSLFNQLIGGEEVSPVGESTSTTTAVLEVSYAECPYFEGRWLVQEALTRLRDYVARHSGSSRIARYGALLDSVVTGGGFEPGGAIRDLRSKSDLRPYIAGEPSVAVQRIRIGLPLEVLRGGTTLVDTPGLNDPMGVRDRITLDAAREADCILFALRGDKLGTESECRFLDGILRSGRALSLLIVVTHIDQLSPAGRAQAVEKARAWVREIAGGASLPAAAARARVFALDARSALGPAEAGVPPEQSFAGLRKDLEEVARDPARLGAYREWVTERVDALAARARREMAAYRAQALDALPDTAALAQEQQLLDSYRALLDERRAAVLAQVASFEARLVEERQRARAALTSAKDLFVAQYRAKVEEQVRLLAAEYHEKGKWEQFDREVAVGLYQRRTSEVERGLEQRWDAWEGEVRKFADGLDQGMEALLGRMDAMAKEITSIGRASHALTSLMCRVDGLMAKAKQTATHVAAHEVGRVGVGTVLGLVLNPLAWKPALLAGGAVLLHKFLANPDKRKQAFVEDKVRAAAGAFEQRVAELQPQVETVIGAIWQRIGEIAETRYRPLLEETLAHAEEHRLRLDLARRAA